MSRQNLESALARLRLELAALGDEASSARSALRVLLDEVEHELEHLETAERAASLRLRVRHQIERFEVEHPRITGILNEIMVSLSNIGILRILVDSADYAHQRVAGLSANAMR